MLSQIIEAVVAFIVILVVAYGVWLYKDRQYQKLEKQNAELIQQAEQLALENTKALATQKENADKEKDEALKRNTAAYQSLVNSLRDRNNRPNTLPSNPQVGSTCTGAQLYREDAEFLAGEAARADKAIIDRDYYYGQYESVRSLLNDRQQGKVSDSKPVP